MGKLTTHVLDLVNGCPGRGIGVKLYYLENKEEIVKQDNTNADGRCDEPLVEGSAFKNGDYKLIFDVGTYHESMGMLKNSKKFLDLVTIQFKVEDASEHYHVPLLLSTYGYSTYRGS